MKTTIVAALILTLISLISPAYSQIEAGQSVKIKIIGVPAEEKERIDGFTSCDGGWRPDRIRSHEPGRRIA
jgi:hypothetical protein